MGLPRTVLVELVETTCWCGQAFALPTLLYDAVYEARSGGQMFYCPLGHSNSFKKGRVKQLEESLSAVRQARDWAEARQATTERKLKRIQSRIAQGICPKCNRSFRNVARHMKSQHGSKRKAKATE